MLVHFMRLAAVTILLGAATANAVAQDLTELRKRASSDDAQTVEEAIAHGTARAAVINNLRPNPLGVGGARFRVKRNPAGTGAFVYEPQTRFSGVERKLVWWVSDQGEAFPVNGAAKAVTPDLEFAPRSVVPSPQDVVSYIFEGKALQPHAQAEPTPAGETFTVKEYHAYRLVVDAPMTISEEGAQRRAGQCLRLSVAQVSAAVKQVQGVLLQNSWMGRPGEEIQHASDWSGQPPVPDC